MTRQSNKKAIWNAQIVKRAIVDSILKLNPKKMMGNPVMFVVEVGSVLTSLQLIRGIVTPIPGITNTPFELQITLWLWFTVLFANFAEAMAEGRGKAQADNLRKAKTETIAHRIVSGDRTEDVAAPQLRKDDVVIVSAGEFIPGDGEIIAGVASVDESAITGESAPVIREAGGDRSAVTGGTRVLSDQIKVRITSNPGETFIDRMIALVEGAERQKTPNEIALNILLAGTHHHFSTGRSYVATVCDLLKRTPDDLCSCITAGLSDSHDDWWTPFRDRYRGHGPADPTQRSCHVRSRG
jgi:K+-transporting ATPase ATPase B chain